MWRRSVLEKLFYHLPHNENISKLKISEYDMLVSFVLDNGSLQKNEIEIKIRQMFRDKEKQKNQSIIEGFLNYLNSGP